MSEVMEYSEVKDLDTMTIDVKVSEMRREIFKMKMESATAKLEKPHRLKVLKKNIARLLTARGKSLKK